MLQGQVRQWRASISHSTHATLSKQASRQAGRQAGRQACMYAWPLAAARAAQAEYRPRSRLRPGRGEFGGARIANTNCPRAMSGVQPNSSVKRSANGMPPGPGLWHTVHFHRPGPGGIPSSPSYLERYASIKPPIHASLPRRNHHDGRRPAYVSHERRDCFGE